MTLGIEANPTTTTRLATGFRVSRETLRDASEARPPSAFARTVPPETFLLVSAVFRYLGPSFAVLLFGYVDVLGVAWLRIASAAAIFVIWRKPWLAFSRLDRRGRRLVIAWGIVLALMNCSFYLAIARLPLGTVAAIEFLPVILLGAIGSRTIRNGVALALAVAGVYLLSKVVFAGEPIGVALAFANAALFALYIVLGHRVAQHGTASGIDALAAAMFVAAIVVTPIGGVAAIHALTMPLAVAAAIGIGVSSSVIPYVTDQLAMSRVRRSTYALLVSLLPAAATVIGVIVLAQVPTMAQLAGIALVIAAVGLHRDAEAA